MLAKRTPQPLARGFGKSTTRYHPRAVFFRSRNANMDLAATRLAAGLSELGLDDERLRGRLMSFVDELVKWNRAYNLTAIRDPAEIVTRHLLDSLTVLPLMRGCVLDAGSGAGLPAIPLALANPDLRITALDSNGKKTRFLRHVQRTLKIANLEIVESRVEHFRPEIAYDIVVSRAFASLSEFFGATRHLLAPSGQWVAMKGKLERAELENIPAGIEIRETRRLSVPGLNQERHAVVATRKA